MATGKKKVLARIMVRPPTRASNGAVTLRQALGGLAKLVRKDAVPKQYKMVVNWGNSTPIQRNGVLVLNIPDMIRLAADKREAFAAFAQANVRIPQVSRTKPERGAKDIWLARTQVAGSGGEGIVVVRPGTELPNAPLYVKYISKLVEYRIHVAGGKVVFAQQKKRRNEVEQTPDQKLIRNYDNGWVFCPLDVEGLNDDVKNQAINAVEAVKLDFGAVDMVIGKGDGLAYVLEINTAPGLESPGLITAYAQAFNSVYEEQVNGC